MPYSNGGSVKAVVATITGKGQVTIPAEVRRHLGVKTRDKITFILEPEGRATVQAEPYPTIASLAGAAGSLPVPMSWSEMRDVAREDRLRAKLGLPP